MDELDLRDFNVAYNPSCSYDPCRVCPLSPENRLAVAVRAGEPMSDTARLTREV